MRLILPSQRTKISMNSSCSGVSWLNGPPVKRPSILESQSRQWMEVMVISPPQIGHFDGTVFINDPLYPIPVCPVQFVVCIIYGINALVKSLIDKYQYFRVDF